MNNQKIIKSNKNIRRWVIVSVFVLAVFILMSSQADAKIVVGGDREFRDDVNDCLTTYRNTPGVVGDVIRELENSENTHTISEGDEWENTPSNQDNAFDGTGTGSETRISKEKLEELKQRIDALKDKDFCTAFLHEMWHAVEADRGEWSDDKQNDVFEDEIQATIFQNFIHAIRGVSPRTTYGGNDISQYLLITDHERETLEESAGDSEPVASPEPEPEPEQEEVSTSVSTSYEHVVPGEYSEIYATITTQPGATVEATLSGPGVSSAASQVQTADGEGVARLTWRIVSYGSYNLSGTANGASFSSSVSVE